MQILRDKIARLNYEISTISPKIQELIIFL